MLKLMDRSTLRELPSAPDEMELPPHREQRSLETTLTYICSNGATLVMSQRPDPRLLPAGTRPRRGELRESMYRDEPSATSSISIRDSVPGPGLDEATAFGPGKRFMRLPRSSGARRPWVAPLDDVDS